MKHKGSLFTNETELLKSILEIHNNGKPIQLDPMYNEGKFYAYGLEKPEYRFDIAPRTNDTQYGDATNLPLESNSISSIILDPPFMFRKMINSKSVIADRYTMFDNFEELEKLYKGIIKEASRVLIKNGILIFKCQDFTNSKTTMTHCYVWKWLEDQGFYVKDLAILNKNWKVANGNLKQRHLRKTHTYFWVGIKR